MSDFGYRVISGGADLTEPICCERCGDCTCDCIFVALNRARAHVTTGRVVRVLSPAGVELATLRTPIFTPKEHAS